MSNDRLIDNTIDKYLEEIKEIVHNDDNIMIVTTENLFEQDLTGVEFLAYTLFAVMFRLDPEALDFFQIIAESDFPGVNVHITPITGDIPDESLGIKIKTLVSDLQPHTQKKLKKYVSKIANDKVTMRLYRALLEQTRKYFRKEGSNLKEL